MSKIRWNYVFLAFSLTGGAITVCDRQPTVFSYMALPLSVILFGLFLIFTFLEKESALYDEQNCKPLPIRDQPEARASQPVNAARPILSAQLH